MCGIFFSYSQKEHEAPSEKLLDDLRKRGPDSVGTRSRTGSMERTTTQLESKEQTCNLNFVSTVLSLRGECIVGQPLEDSKSGSLLCWNGEAWRIGNEIVQGNDAEAVFSLLLNAAQSCNVNASDRLSSYDQSKQNIFETIATITGPYAFVFYDAQSTRVFYGRDALGRRSLLIKSYGVGSLGISSVSDATDAHGWIEVEADGINMLDIRASLVSSSQRADRTTHVPWAADPKPDLSYHLVQSLLFYLFPHLLRH